jgi:hypothetical protein
VATVVTVDFLTVKLIKIRLCDGPATFFGRRNFATLVPEDLFAG